MTNTLYTLYTQVILMIRNDRPCRVRVTTRTHNIYVIGVARLTAHGPCPSAQGLSLCDFTHTHISNYISHATTVSVYVINYYSIQLDRGDEIRYVWYHGVTQKRIKKKKSKKAPRGIHSFLLHAYFTRRRSHCARANDVIIHNNITLETNYSMYIHFTCARVYNTMYYIHINNKCKYVVLSDLRRGVTHTRERATITTKNIIILHIISIIVHLYFSLYIY